MELRVNLVSGTHDSFLNVYKYQTNAEGELDILSDSDFVIATYAKGQWVSARRLKHPSEEWPDSEVVAKKDDDDSEPNFRPLSSLPKFDM